MTDYTLPDGIVLRDSFPAPCGCRFGSVTPAEVGIAAAPGEEAFVCIPCSLLCPSYAYFLEATATLAKPVVTQVRNTE